MRIEDKRYGWSYGSLKNYILALIFCRGNHKTYDLGDPCYCGSDNCDKCRFCGIENHD